MHDFPEIFSDLDEHFARFMVRLSGDNSRKELHLAAAFTSSRTREGHVCFDLAAVAGKGVMDNGPAAPPLDDWVRILRESHVVGWPGDFKPLILDGRHRLYLYRYWNYEKKLIDFIRTCADEGAEADAYDFPRLKESLSRLFPERGYDPDWQKVAAAVSLLRRFTVISGSPGTGKTSTVTRILALLLEMAKDKMPRIALAAPTGKAAARLQEAIRNGRETINAPEAVKAAIPGEASTIHRLLGAVSGSSSFRHSARNPLSVDAVVVDEASMVDLPLMSKLVQALPDAAQLILLGDRDQLSSVEAGAVLGDICGEQEGNAFSIGFREKLKEATCYDLPGNPYGGQTSGIGNSIVMLRENYRFGSQSGISRVSAVVNKGDGDAALGIMKSGCYPDIQWLPLPQVGALSFALKSEIINNFSYYMQLIDSKGDIERAFCAIETFRILCALREGPYGAKAVNRTVENILEERKLIMPDTRWYHGRPIIITRNDYNLRLFNGDLGLIIADGRGSGTWAYFVDAVGSLKRFAPLRLPDHETVYAMTVHKSQGSEFDRVLLLLPDRDSPVLSRELIYTGITRAKESVHVWGREDVFHEAVSRRIVRNSGLGDALWGYGDDQRTDLRAK